jgi:hypothetical protein
MPVVTVVVETFFTFGDSQKVIVAPSSFYIKEISSSFARFQSLGKDAVIVSFLLIVVFVLHS